MLGKEEPHTFLAINGHDRSRHTFALVVELIELLSNKTIYKYERDNYSFARPNEKPTLSINVEFLT